MIHGRLNDLPIEVRKVLDDERERRKARPHSRALDAPIPHEPPSELHKSVIATAKALRNAKPDKDEVVTAVGPGFCGVTVGIASVERAVRILDGLARELENRQLALVSPGTL